MLRRVYVVQKVSKASMKSGFPISGSLQNRIIGPPWNVFDVNLADNYFVCVAACSRCGLLVTSKKITLFVIRIVSPL